MKSPSVFRPFISLLLILACAQFACGFLRASPGASGSAGSGGSQPASSGSGSCANTYLPIKVGATWTHTGQVSNGTYTRVTTVSSVAADSFDIQSSLTQNSGKQIATIESWKCTSDGLVQLGGPLAATFQGLSGGITLKTLSTTGVTLPASINPGDTWSQSSQLEFTTPNGTFPGSLTYTFKAIGLEQVTVPAGSFNAMKIQVTSSSQSTVVGQTMTITTDGFTWFASGVGQVKTTSKLALNGSPFADVEGDLQSYHIP